MRERIVVDLGGWRYTHYPSEDTCLRQPYMSETVWTEKLQTFLDTYPGVYVEG